MRLFEIFSISIILALISGFLLIKNKTISFNTELFKSTKFKQLPGRKV